MKLSVPHWVIVLVALLGAVAPQVGHAFPVLAPAMAVVVQLATLVVGALGLVTGSALTSEQFPEQLRRHQAKLAAAVIGAAMMALCLAACFGQPTPAQQAENAAAELQCVQTHWGETVEAVALACTGNELELAADLLADVEAIFERAAPDAGVPATFAYRDDPRVMGKLVARRAVPR